MKILHAVFIVGGVALYFCVLKPYLLLDAGSVMLILAFLCFVSGAVLFQARGARPVKLQHVGAAAAPWLFTAFLLANGALDQSPEDIHETSVIETHYGRSWDVVIVRSWRAGQNNESLYLRTSLLSPGKFHYPGDPLTVAVKPGAFRLPWVTRISP